MRVSVALVFVLVYVLVFALAYGLDGCHRQRDQRDQADPGMGWPPIQCSTPCVIKESEGGVIDYFVAFAKELKARGTPVIVDGVCASACTILVDIDRANVCITPNALLEYHMGVMMDKDGDEHFMPVNFETPGLNAYIEASGGLPKPDSGHLLTLGFHEARQFYKPCVGA